MTAWDTSRPFRRGQGLLVVLAGLALVPAVVSAVLRLFPPREDGPALLASFIPYGLLGFPIALLLLVIALVRARRRVALGVATLLVALVTVAPVLWLGPLFLADRRPATTAPFTVLSLNVEGGRADPAALARESGSADVVVLIESTPAGLAALGPYGWNARFPYALGTATDEANNTVVYSRYPLGPSSVVEASFRQWDTIVRVPEIGEVRLLAVHPCNPFCGGGLWASEHDRLNEAILADLDRPVVAVGDFNAIDDHGPMQELRRAGLRSATDLTGAGWLPTYPAGRAFPPLIPIDHALVNDRLTAVSVRTPVVPGTDHRGLLVSLAGTR